MRRFGKYGRISLLIYFVLSTFASKLSIRGGTGSISTIQEKSQNRGN